MDLGASRQSRSHRRPGSAQALRRRRSYRGGHRHTSAPASLSRELQRDRPPSRLPSRAESQKVRRSSARSESARTVPAGSGPVLPIDRLDRVDQQLVTMQRGWSEEPSREGSSLRRFAQRAYDGLARPVEECSMRSSSASYRLSRPTLALLSCSGVMSASSNVAQSSRASRKFAPRRSAPARLASLRSASLRFAPRKSAALRSTPARFAPLKLAPASRVLLRFALLRSTLLKSVRPRPAPARLTSPRLASLKSMPSSSIGVSGCSSLHVFQVVATPCFNRSSCCWFLIVISLLYGASQTKLWKDCQEVILGRLE